MTKKFVRCVLLVFTTIVVICYMVVLFLGAIYEFLFGRSLGPKRRDS